MSTATASRTTTPVARESRHVDPTRRQQAVAAWVLALPFMVLFLVFTAGPVLASLGMSFTDIRSTDMRTPFAVGFTGLDNYTRLLGDPLFQKVMLNTFEYLVLGGAREFDFIVSHLPEKVESHFGDGSRWGCRFNYHLSTNAERSWGVLRNICAGYSGTCCWRSPIHCRCCRI